MLTRMSTALELAMNKPVSIKLAKATAQVLFILHD